MFIKLFILNKYMEIAKDIEIIDLGLYLTKYKTLVLADTHLGFEESLNKNGVFIPRFHIKDLTERLEKILKNLEIDKIIINGDIKHEFKGISEQEWRNTIQIIDLLKQKCKELILIRGNHDKILNIIAAKKELKIADQIVIDDILITHGHKMLKIPTSVKKIIIGHEHPAVGLHEGARIETFKCFLKGKFNGKLLIVMPSLNLVTEGTDVTKEKLLSPFLQQDLNNFEAFVVADKVYYFGKLKGLENE